MDDAVNIIRALVSILNHNATNFSGVNRATLRQIEGTIQTAEGWLEVNASTEVKVDDEATVSE
jgi:hypothetical protein